jgi:hypothetical protein
MVGRGAGIRPPYRCRRGRGTGPLGSDRAGVRLLVVSDTEIRASAREPAPHPSPYRPVGGPSASRHGPRLAVDERRARVTAAPAARGLERKTRPAYPVARRKDSRYGGRPQSSRPCVGVAAAVVLMSRRRGRRAVRRSRCDLHRRAHQRRDVPRCSGGSDRAADRAAPSSCRD